MFCDDEYLSEHNSESLLCTRYYFQNREGTVVRKMDTTLPLWKVQSCVGKGQEGSQNSKHNQPISANHTTEDPAILNSIH